MAIAAFGGAFSADKLYYELQLAGAACALNTVYQTLNRFESSGLLIRGRDESRHAIFWLKQPDGDQYTLRLRCPHCGRVKEVYAPMAVIKLREAMEMNGLATSDLPIDVNVDCLICAA